MFSTINTKENNSVIIHFLHFANISDEPMYINGFICFKFHEISSTAFKFYDMHFRLQRGIMQAEMKIELLFCSAHCLNMFYICAKCGENSFNRFKSMDHPRLVKDRQTDRQGKDTYKQIDRHLKMCKV